jgi:hypothetical protein
MTARRLLALVLAITALGSASEREHEDLDRDSGETARQRRVLSMRVAAADRLIEGEDEIRAYVDAGFNTVVLYDTENGLLKSEERIAFETGFARAHGLRIILGKATEPLTAVTPERTASAASHHRKRTLAAASSAVVSDDEIRARLHLWDRYAADRIVGVFFLHDDAFFIRTSVDRQRHLYELARRTVPDWDVFGMIGEFGFSASAEDVERYFDPAAFDHLIMLMYPLNLGYVTEMPIDTIASPDPDADMKRAVHRYITHMGKRFIQRLRPGQLTILVVQTFTYHGEPAGHIPRSSDVTIQASLGTDLLRELPGQEGNRSLAYFLWDGSRSGMSGLWQRTDWADAARQVHSSQERLRDSAPAQRRASRGR